MGITESSQEVGDGSKNNISFADDRTRSSEPTSPLMIPRNIENYPEYLNPFNSDADEVDKRISSTVKVTVTELRDGMSYEGDSIHSSMTTLTDESGSSKSKRKRRRRKLKVQIGSIENMNVSSTQSLEESKSKGTYYERVDSNRDLIKQVESANISPDTLKTETPKEDESPKPRSNLFCLSFKSSKDDDICENGQSTSNKDDKTVMQNEQTEGSSNMPPSIPGRKKKKKNKGKKEQGTIELPGDSTKNENEADVSCGKLKNIFSRRKSKEEESSEKKPVEEPMIVPTKVTKEKEINQSVPNQNLSNVLLDISKGETKNKKKHKKKENLAIERTDNFIQYADIVKDNESMPLHEVQTIEISPNTVDRANEIVHLDDAHLHNAVKSDFITLRDQKHNKNTHERGKRWNTDAENKEISIENSVLSSGDLINEASSSKTILDISDEKYQAEEDCKKIDALFNQILMENDITETENKATNINTKESQYQYDSQDISNEGEFPSGEKTSKAEITMPTANQSSDQLGLKNITVTQSNNGGKDILEIKPLSVMISNSCTHDNNLITSTCFQENFVTYEFDGKLPTNETSNGVSAVCKEHDSTFEGTKQKDSERPVHELISKAEEQFVYFDESGDEDKNSIKPLANENLPMETLNITGNNAQQSYNNLSPKSDSPTTNKVVSFEEDEILQNLLNNLMLSEETNRCNPMDMEASDNTEVEGSTEFDDANNVYIEEYIDDLEDRLERKSYEEVIIKKDYNVRSMPETCYISVPGCRYLDVITEEASDISDGERNRVISAIEVSDVEDDNSSDENDPSARIHEANSESSDGNGGGIDISWQGKTLEEIDDVEILYEEEDSPNIVLQDEIVIKMEKSEESNIDLSMTQPNENDQMAQKEMLNMFSLYGNDIKTAKIKDLEKPQRAQVLETNSPKSVRRAVDKKKREAFFSESLDILNTSFSSYGGEQNFATKNVELDLSNNYPDLINVKNTFEKATENTDQKPFQENRVETLETNVTPDLAKSNPLYTDETPCTPYQIGKSPSSRKITDVLSNDDDNNYCKNENEDPVIDAISPVIIDDLPLYYNDQVRKENQQIDNNTSEDKLYQMCRRQTSSSSDTTQSTEKNQHYNMTPSRVKSLKEMAIDHLLIQPNGFETLLDIGIPIHEILEDITGSNETLNYIETENADGNNQNNIQPILSHVDQSLDSTKAPTPPPRRDSYIRMELGSDFTRSDFAVPSSNILTPQSCPMSPRSSSSLSSVAYPINQINDQWLGLPSEDPQLVVCLSPSQSSSSKPMTPKEVSGLIDLHQKFVDRRGYHESRDTSSISTPDSGRKTPLKNRHLNSTSMEEEHKSKSFERNDGDFYTPELLQEAANLLSLKHYHDCRQRRMVQENPPKDITKLPNVEDRSISKVLNTENSEVNIDDNNASDENKPGSGSFVNYEASEVGHFNAKTIKKTEMDNKFENESRPSKLLALIQEYKQPSCVMECIPERETGDMHNADEPLYSTNQSKFKSETINTPNRNTSEQSECLAIENNMNSSRIPTRSIINHGEFSEKKENNYHMGLKSDTQRVTDNIIQEDKTPYSEDKTETGDDGQSKINTKEYDNINSSIQQEIEKLESFDFETLLKTFEDKNKPVETFPLPNEKPSSEDKTQNSVIVQYKISKKGDIAELNDNYDFEKQEVIKRDTSKVIVHINKITTKDNVNIVEEVNNNETHIPTSSKSPPSEVQSIVTEFPEDSARPFETNDIGVQTVERKDKKSKIPVKKNQIGLPMVLNQQKSSCTHQRNTSHNRKSSQSALNQVQKSKSAEIHKSSSSSSTPQLESMYNEYMKEISAKRDRRKKRMIRLEEKSTSLTNIKETINASDIYTTSIKVKNQLENEFMNKVQQRMNKYGINMKDYEVTNDYFSSDDDSDAREVPKHLQEFIEISKTGESDMCVYHWMSTVCVTY